VPYTPHIMGHMDDQTRRKLMGKLVYFLISEVRNLSFECKTTKTFCSNYTTTTHLYADLKIQVTCVLTKVTCFVALVTCVVV